MKKYLMAAVAITFLSTPAFAAKAKYHCMGKDNQEIPATATNGGKMTSAECKAAGGKWMKMKMKSTSSSPSSGTTSTTTTPAGATKGTPGNNGTGGTGGTATPNPR